MAAGGVAQWFAAGGVAQWFAAGGGAQRLAEGCMCLCLCLCQRLCMCLCLCLRLRQCQRFAAGGEHSGLRREEGCSGLRLDGGRAQRFGRLVQQYDRLGAGGREADLSSRRYF